MTFLKIHNLVLIASTIALLFAAVPPAYAAPLNFSTAETVLLSSPSTMLTIATGSAADAITVNATSLLVTLSAATGGRFTLLSPSYDLIVSTSSAGSLVTVSCGSSVESATLAQSSGSTVYTITPSGSNCANPVTIISGWGNSGGGGGTGSSSTSTTSTSTQNTTSTLQIPTSTPITTTSTAATSTASSTASLQAEITSLLAEVQQLEAQLAVKNSTAGESGGTTYHFTRDLQLRDTGADVTALQRYLIAQNTGPTAQAIRAHGVTRTFGTLTYAALKEFQKSVGLPPTGFFGPQTRNYIASHD